MSDVLTEAIREVPVEIYDFTKDTPDGLLAGFYYSIPMPESVIREIPLHGPHETRGAALDAARAFIADCLTNHNDGTEE